jgi:hypothetical protein
MNWMQMSTRPLLWDPSCRGENILLSMFSNSFWQILSAGHEIKVCCRVQRSTHSHPTFKGSLVSVQFFSLSYFPLLGTEPVWENILCWLFEMAPWSTLVPYLSHYSAKCRRRYLQICAGACRPTTRGHSRHQRDVCPNTPSTDQVDNML